MPIDIGEALLPTIQAYFETEKDKESLRRGKPKGNKDSRIKNFIKKKDPVKHYRARLKFLLFYLNNFDMIYYA